MEMYDVAVVGGGDAALCAGDPSDQSMKWNKQ
jgi:thioredoxin reductase